MAATTTARELWELALDLVDRADELGIAIASISAHSRGADVMVAPNADGDVRDDVDTLGGAKSKSMYHGRIYRRGAVFGASGAVLPDGVVVIAATPALLVVAGDESRACYVTRNDLRIFGESPTILTRSGVTFTPDLVGALQHIAARELVTA